MDFEEFYEIMTKDKDILVNNDVIYRGVMILLYNEINRSNLTKKEVMDYSKVFNNGFKAGTIFSSRGLLKVIQE